LILVPDSGHATNIDQPLAFNAVLKEFLAGR
jgi:pimeloyl-ACP methyl ester carboxylesterase